MKNKKPMIARVILKINKKSYRKQVNKNKTNSGEPFKPRLTFKTYNSWNPKFERNQADQFSINLMLNDETEK